jgi:hypothetical protein
MDDLDLIRAWICTASLTFAFVLAFVLLFWLRRRRRPQPLPTSSLPDFAILDCGESIHLVPVEGSHHRVDNTGRCPCGPVVSINQRRRGTRVRYVDHRPVRAMPFVPPSVHT